MPTEIPEADPISGNRRTGPHAHPAPERIPSGVVSTGALQTTRARTVRLIVSIPAIMTMVALVGGVLIRGDLLSLTEGAALSPKVNSGIELAANYVLWLSGAVAVLSALIGLFLALRIVGPLREIEESMAAVARGELPSSPLLPPAGELGDLGITFNDMVVQLQRVFRERDRQIREAGNKTRLLLDAEGIVVSADSALRRVLAVNPRDLVGHSMSDATLEPLVSMKPLCEAVAKLVDDARLGLVSDRNVTVARGGEQVQLSVSISLLQGDTGGPDRFLLEVRDLSGMRSFHEQMHRADRLAAIGTLATGIAHEIRNPLASIKGMVQLMQEQERTGALATPAEYHARIVAEIERLDKLVSSIMEFARGGTSPPEATDLNSMLREVMEAARHSAGATGDNVEISLDLDPALPHATVQPARMRQAFLNLARNAFEATSQHGGGKVRVSSLFLRVNEERPIIICVSNPSDPIPPEKLEHFFEPFFTTKPSGTGLGLPIAYQSVLANGGVLEADCEEGEIRFWVRLPAEPPPSMRTPLPIRPRSGG